MKKYLFFVLSLVIFMNTLTACQKTDAIIMGTSANFPPFEYHDGDEIVGLDIEIGKKIAEKLGRELIVNDITFAGLLTALQVDKVDFVAAGMTIKPERLENADFSDEYFEASQVIVLMKDNDEIKGADDLVGKKIGVQLGTTGADEAKEIEDALVSEYNAAFQAILDMRNNKIDAVIIDNEPAKNFVKENDDIKILDEPLTIEKYAIAVKKGNTELLAVINEVLREIKESGEFEQIVDKYFK